MLINSRTNSNPPAFGASYDKVCRVYENQGKKGISKILGKELSIGNFEEAELTIEHLRNKGINLAKTKKNDKGVEAAFDAGSLFTKFAESTVQYVQKLGNKPVSKNFENFLKKINLTPEAFKEKVFSTKI